MNSAYKKKVNPTLVAFYENIITFGTLKCISLSRVTFTLSTDTVFKFVLSWLTEHQDFEKVLSKSPCTKFGLKQRVCVKSCYGFVISVWKQ